jgi:hypothetical protein
VRVGRSRAYGFRVGEVPLPSGTAVKDSLRIAVHPAKLTRRVVACKLPVSFAGFLMPHPCPGDTATLLAGIQKRLAAAPPDFDPELRKEFRAFVFRFIQRFRPLDRDVDFDAWLAERPYPAWRKEELRRRRVDRIEPHHRRVKMFMKDEHYPDYKHARAINSRTDEFKTYVGPFFSRIEKVVFELDHFIKRVPFKDRADYVINKLYRPGAIYYSTDYTSFEAMFTDQMMLDCEMQLYRHMLVNYPDVMDEIEKTMTGVNVMVNKGLSVSIKGTRMSGEMCTSLGNGFSNLMFASFVAEKSGAKIDLVIEGDDGLIVSDKPLDESLFRRLGLSIKIQRFEDLCEASFCGIVCDLVARTIVTDPREFLSNIGWTNGVYERATAARLADLQLAKALSYLCQYPGCPIIQPLCLKIVQRSTFRWHRLWSIVNSKRINQYEREQMSMALETYSRDYKPPEIRYSSRLLVEKLYGVSVADQIAIENLTVEDINSRYHDWPFIPDSWKDYYSRYVCDVVEELPDPERLAVLKKELFIEEELYRTV